MQEPEIPAIQAAMPQRSEHDDEENGGPAPRCDFHEYAHAAGEARQRREAQHGRREQAGAPEFVRAATGRDVGSGLRPAQAGTLVPEPDRASMTNYIFVGPRARRAPLGAQRR